ncbi:MAG: 23S rRNA (uracil-C(5))-methyltransferase RlmCD [Candidatus Cloacimonetes bacterium ADurb.Bin089]|nr:MAG: 23S rRNA (uracil-C(5))-methyltransferase RlmCD [Candidatus Cloacimonetes bacterium ADurb.Bin089]
MKQILKLKIEKMAMGGLGIAYAEGKAIFVPYTAIGDIVDIDITVEKKDYAYGKVKKYISYSDLRVEVKCPSFAAEIPCGGCDWLMLKYSEQLKQKNQLLLELFSPFIDKALIYFPAPAPQIKHYRNKVFMPVGKNIQTGKITFGMYARYSHQIVEHITCENHPPIFDQLANSLMEFCLKAKVEPYNEIEHRGQLRYIGFRGNSEGSQILVILVTLSGKLPFTNLLVKKLTSEFPAVKGIIQNINRQKGNVILGNETKLLYGSENLDDNLCGLKFRVNYRSFWQINTRTMEMIIFFLQDFVHPKDVIVDAYCGIGAIGLSLAAKVKRVILLEEFPPAIEDARLNAVSNKIQNVSFRTGKVEDNLTEVLEKEKPDVLIMDPPRSGVQQKALEAIIQAQVKQILYLSCSPMTLARDLNTLLAGEEYKVVFLQPFDMFPNTWHIECLAYLQQKDYYIRNGKKIPQGKR